jgi:hypothetical protein
MNKLMEFLDRVDREPYGWRWELVTIVLLLASVGLMVGFFVLLVSHAPDRSSEIRWDEMYSECLKTHSVAECNTIKIEEIKEK